MTFQVPVTLPPELWKLSREAIDGVELFDYPNGRELAIVAGTTEVAITPHGDGWQFACCSPLVNLPGYEAFDDTAENLSAEALMRAVKTSARILRNGALLRAARQLTMQSHDFKKIEVTERLAA